MAAQTEDVETLLLQGHDMIERTTRAHRERWGLGSAQRWDLDQTTGLIRWTFADRVVSAPAAFLGSYANGTWRWAWANPSVVPALRAASEAVRRWGEANGQPFLVRPELEVGEEQARDLAAIAFRLTGATGLYRAPAGSGVVYVTFGAVTVTAADGTAETFSIEVG